MKGDIEKLKVAIWTCEHHQKIQQAKRKLQWEFLLKTKKVKCERWQPEQSEDFSMAPYEKASMKIFSRLPSARL